MGKHKKYSASIRLQAVKIFLEGEKSGSAIAKELGIHTPRRIEQWVAAYEKYGEEGFIQERRGKSTGSLKGRPKKSSEQKELEYLRAKVALLEALAEHRVKKK
ncbi:MAG: helix-turn-helix domain-containing protein [Candidatus Delongbacteria bacterium]|nr:helix-turn-helix domain-containing protein [Candidatus Delongbacteria bacterium]